MWNALKKESKVSRSLGTNDPSAFDEIVAVNARERGI